MPKKSIKPRKQTQTPKVSNKVKIQLEPNPSTHPTNAEYQEHLNKATSPVFVGMPPVVMQDIRRLPSKEETYKEIPPREDTEETKTSFATNPFVKEEIIKEYPMTYTGKTKSQWEKFRAMVNRRKPIQAVTNWFKNLFK